MKTVRALGITFIAILALGAVTASGAAAHEWRMRGEGLLGPLEVTSTPRLVFESAVEGTELICEFKEKGYVGAGAAGEVTSITSVTGEKVIGCTVARGNVLCEKNVELEALKLPWKTELVTIGGELRNKTSGTPEWKIRCKSSSYGTITDLCEVSSNTGVRNVGGDVEELYDSKSPHPSCTDMSLVATGSGIVMPKISGIFEAV